MGKESMRRRDPEETTGVSTVKSGFTLEKPKSRDRTWDKNNPAHSYRIPDWIDREIDKLTRGPDGERMLNKSQVVAYLLKYALEAVQNEELQIQPVPGRGKFTLFPEG